MVKTEFLQIRLSPTDRSRIERAAQAEHLDLSTWARQAILRRLESWEKAQVSNDDDTKSSAVELARGDK
jgi:uncharacterized protein (DUF1778 family)